MTVRDLKLGTKQSLGFGIVLLFMAAVSVFAIFQMAALRTEIDDTNEIWLQRVVLSSRFHLNASALRTVQLQHAFAPQTTQKQVYIDTMLVLIDNIDVDRDVYAELLETAAQEDPFSERENRLTARLDSLWDVYLDHSLTYLDLDNEDALALLNGDAGEVFGELSADLAGLVHLNEARAAEAAQRAETTFTGTRNRIIVLLIFTILISGIIAGWLARLVIVPVRQLVNAARKVADGNFNVHVTSVSKDEIGTLTHSFSSMARSLEKQQADLHVKNQDLEQALQQLRDTQQQLLLKEKMASLSQLTAGIAHELKNPLNFINNFSQLSIDIADDLKQELSDNSKQPVADVMPDIQDLIDDLTFNAAKINEHGKRADRIVLSMMQHARRGRAERSAVDLNALVEEYVKLGYHGMRASTPSFKVNIRRAYDEQIGEVEVVQEEIGRVILNIVTNAFYAVHERAQTGEEGYEPQMTVGSRINGKNVAVWVQDNGSGIPEDVRAKIFDPFFTTKPSGAGTGLGLSLSHEIVVEGHGGDLTCESEEGQGATFTIMLPNA
ncbi:MAG: ATP-binding protein [Bacteroidota bacterium]